MHWLSPASDRLRRLLRGREPWRRYGFPRADEIDRARLARDMELQLPKLEFVMFFTPRSGSSWVSDVLSRTRRMGSIGESFNPTFLPRMTRAMNATTLADYCAVLGRRRQGNGVFGFQITHHQLRAVFGSDAAFLAHYPARHSVWLVRRDIVLQAVSLHKMQVTQLGHAPRAHPDEISAREAGFAYDADAIRYWIRHIHAAERGTEALIAAAGLTPLRMSYEQNVALKANHVANVIGRHIGLPTMRMKPLNSPHQRIATPRNTDFAERFRREHPEFLAEIEAERAPMLERIQPYGPKG